MATWSGDTLRLRTTPGRAIPLPLASISRLELSTGRRGHVVKGSVIGFAVGAVLGAVSGASSTTPCRTNAGAPCASDATSRSSSIFAASSFLGVSGAMVGGGIGAFVRTDRWADSTVLVRR
ncbi:MAG: hypothetical protein K2R93_14990 [Gemmatimonadaceae bacterium]|nr:hypothetical protein [Gemmatimonadaceae bacterium]